MRSLLSRFYVYWGIDSDQLTPADYNGDGKTDPALYTNGIYHIFDSATAEVLYLGGNCLKNALK